MKLKSSLIRGAIVALCAVGVAQAASGDSQPWRDATQTPEVRAAQLLKAMTLEQKITLVSAVDPAEYAPLAALGIPALTRVDASAGLRGDRGVTAFPVPLQLGASFDVELARDYGKAIAEEARAKGWNVILGPTVDVARDGLSGRLTESYGEDALVNAELGTAVAGAMQGQGVITMAKHYTAYHTEYERLTMSLQVSQRALNEVYNLPFYYLIEKANLASIMGSYPQVNGKYMLENAELISAIKQHGFKGYLATDFMGGRDGVAQFNAGVDSWALQPFLRKPEALRDGRIPNARLDDAVRRTLWAIFSTGVFDRPVTDTPAAVVTTAAHQALALKVAQSGTVLLKNEGGVLPLKRSGQIAVLGPAGKDVVTGVMWSSYVDPGQFTTPLEAIAATAGEGAKVVYAQGSLGDTLLPSLASTGSVFTPPVSLTTPDGKPGWEAQYFGSEDFSGAVAYRETVRQIDVTVKPQVDLPDKWSAKWRAELTPTVDGLVRFATSVSGAVKVTVDGKPVIDGHRSTSEGFPGSGPSTYPLQGTVQLSAGKKVRIEVEYAARAHFSGPRLQVGWQPVSLIPEAVALARKSDVAVVFVNQVTGEEMDRDNYALPADQDALVEAVAAVNPNTVVVLNTGGAVKMPWLSRVKGVVQMWYPGAAAGTGIASVLFGEADPGGRLPVSFLAGEEQGIRPYRGGGTVHYDEGVNVGYRYLLQHQQQPLFPFGYGLSYSTYSLGDLSLRASARANEAALVSVRARNTGTRAGSTVVQVYSGEPVKLVGFTRVQLNQGEERMVTIPVERRLLSSWDEKAGRWIAPTGKVVFKVGQHVGDLPLKGELRY